MPMKAITIWQPWASLIACGAKKYETRGWATSYRGPIAIHAALRSEISAEAKEVLASIPLETLADMKKAFRCEWGELPKGAVIATAKLVNVWAIIYEPDMSISGRLITPDRTLDERNAIIVPTEQEKTFGDWTPGRFAWELDDVKILDAPVSAKGQQGLWNWEPKEGV